MVTSVQDDGTAIVGVASSDPGSSPHNLLADTLGDELKLATQGKARVFGIGFSRTVRRCSRQGFYGDGAYWIDRKTGRLITIAKSCPSGLRIWTSGNHAGKYWNQEWKNANGKVLRSTAPRKNKKGEPASFHEVVGSTPLANDYEFEFARELAEPTKSWGAAPPRIFWSSACSANDILGHQVGPDSPEMQAMVLAMDRQLADFFFLLGQQAGGLANLWIALSADHGVSPLPSVASALHIPAAGLGNDTR